MTRRFAVAVLMATTVATGVSATTRSEPIQLKYAYAGSPASLAYTEAVVPFAEQITRAADGAIEVKLFPGNALASAQNVYDRLLNGVFEMCYGILGFYQEQFPKATVAMLPFESGNAHEAGLALWRLHERGVMGDEMAAVKVLALPVFTNMSIHARKPIQAMADFQGVKVATMSRTMGDIVDRLGGTPIALPHTDFYAGLQRGTVGAAGVGWVGLKGLKLAEVTSYHLEVPLMGEGGFHFMNKAAFAKLPAQAQAAIDAASGVKFSDMLAAAIQKMDDDGRSYTLGLPGHALVQLPDAEVARWRNQLAPLTEAWVKATPDGARVLSAYREEVARIRAGQ